jgi:hypothetical protein
MQGEFMHKQRVKLRLENNSMEVALEVLGKSIARWTENGEQHITAVPGLSLFRREEPTEPISGMYEPSLCLVAQRAKRVLLGDDPVGQMVQDRRTSRRAERASHIGPSHNGALIHIFEDRHLALY